MEGRIKRRIEARIEGALEHTMASIIRHCRLLYVLKRFGCGPLPVKMVPLPPDEVWLQSILLAERRC